MSKHRWPGRALILVFLVAVVGLRSLHSSESRPAPAELMAEETLARLACPASAAAVGHEAITEVILAGDDGGLGFGHRVVFRHDGWAVKRVSADLSLDRWLCGHVDTGEFARLAALIESKGFFQLDDHYGPADYWVLPDVKYRSSFVSTTVRRDATSKTVIDYAKAGPTPLADIEAAIEVLASGVRWDPSRVVIKGVGGVGLVR